MAHTKDVAISDIARWGFKLGETEDIDDWSSSWKEVMKSGGVWGGRKKGGRGVRVSRGPTENISVDGVSLQFLGKTLLSSCKLVFLRGHRYGLVGQNGIGKVSLRSQDRNHSIS
jgi:hypothetical protein